MSSIKHTFNCLSPAGLEVFFEAYCDCGPLGQSKSFIDSDLPTIWTLGCGAEFRIMADHTCHPLVPNQCQHLAAVTTLNVMPRIQWVPPLQPGDIIQDPDVFDWAPAAPEPAPTECYCFGPPVDDCPTHGKKK